MPPPFKRHIFICTNRRPEGHPKGCCASKGSEEIKETLKIEAARRGLKGIVRVNSAGCLDACEQGVSIVVYPEGVWYGNVTLADVNDILEEHLVNGRVVERLLMKRFERQKPQRVVFACVHNAGRSQMAAALFNRAADPTKARAISAGTQPGPAVHPEVLDAMRELGVDLTQSRPQLLTDELAKGASLLVTMGCGEACPVVPGLKREDWPLPDPKGQPPEVVRKIRDEIADRVASLLKREGWGNSGTPA